jgi:predicted chitinase
MADQDHRELSRSTVPDGPYPGLRPFEPHEWSIFFGREVMASEVIARLGRQNLILVHGASGCGKSSLVRAGVLPALQSDHALNRREFRYSILRPSQGPLDALAAALLAQLGPADPEDPEQSWLDRIVVERDLVGTIERRLGDTRATFCLIVDQFEEIFRWAEERDRAEAEFLVDFMKSVSQREAGSRNFFILATMRSDYLGQCAQFNGFAGVVNQCQYLLDNLDEFGILRAIHEPAERFGGSVEAVLADRLRFSSKDDADALPILQHSLMRMYDALPDKGPGWVLGLEGLAEVSGDDGALSEHAEAIYRESVGDSPGRAAALEWMFRALTDLDAAGRAVRRPCRFEELVAVSGTDEATVRELVEAFSRPGRNFLVSASSERGGVEIDVSHEALIRRWRRLGDSNVDPDTGQRAGWLYREFQAGLIWKALAVFAKRGERALDAETTRQWLPFFEQVETRPAWAARYFVDPVPGVPPEEQPEWLAVTALMAASKARMEKESQAWRRVLIRWWGVLLAFALLFAVGAIAWGIQLDKKREGDLEKVRQTRDAAISDAGEAKRRANEAETKGLSAQVRGEIIEERALAAQAKARRDIAQAKAQVTQARNEVTIERSRVQQLKRDADRILANAKLEVSSILRATLPEGIEVVGTDGVGQIEVRLPPNFRDEIRSILKSEKTMLSAGLDSDEIADLIDGHRKDYGLTTNAQLAEFLAAIIVDSENLSSLEENLDFEDYKVRKIFAMWSIPLSGVETYIHQPQKLANAIYRGRYGNTEPGDGWAYRGRGLLITRGKAEYRELGRSLNIDLLGHPELLNTLRYAVLGALERWRSRHANREANSRGLLAGNSGLLGGRITISGYDAVLAGSTEQYKLDTLTASIRVKIDKALGIDNPYTPFFNYLGG